MILRVEVFPKAGLVNPAAEEIKKNLQLLGFRKAEVSVTSIYFLEFINPICRSEDVAQNILCDLLCEDFRVFHSFLGTPLTDSEFEITFNPGVFDPVSNSVKLAVENLLGSGVIRNTRTAKRLSFRGIALHEIQKKCLPTLYNPLIEHILDYEKLSVVTTLDEFMKVDAPFLLRHIQILDVSDEMLQRVGKQGLSLTLEEMRVIRDYFSRQKRNPTDCELETIAQTWSEHCNHKTFRGIIRYAEHDVSGVLKSTRTIHNLLKSTIMKATEESESSLCVSVFHDNAGVIRFDEKYNICFKVETHNHPSALEPYGGASTGIGGVIRDILGTGCGAYPIASTDVFCFAPWDIADETLPQGVLAPRRIIRGVVSGVRDYGNKMGIPTVNGAVLFDQRFLGNPLVFCGTVGILPQEKSFKVVHPGQKIVVLGGRTGKDGIHGATFSSLELDTSSSVISSSAVQIGNPIEEKKTMVALIRARDENLFSAVTDCGAGGLSSAVGEITKDFGCRVHLEKVPLKYKGLSYTEIWISESQERMILVLDETSLQRFQQICKEEEVESAVIGEVTQTHRLELFYKDNPVCNLDMEFLHEGTPKLTKNAVWVPKPEEACDLSSPEDYAQLLKQLLSSNNICSKEWIIRQYDHEVQAGTLIKPLMGSFSGPSDGAVVRPIFSSKKALAIANGINPFFSDNDPYWMAGLVIDEALRNTLCVGGTLGATALLDNFAWGSVDDEKVLGSLVRAAEGCYDFAKGFGVPFISGKDSLYNEYKMNEQRIVIPGTLLISSIAVLEDIENTLTVAFKKENNLLYVLGITKDELGCSEYGRLRRTQQGILPKVDVVSARELFSIFSAGLSRKLFVSAHDCSEGGLGVCLAEMAFSSGFGAEVFLSEVPYQGVVRDDFILFSETPSRFVVEVEPAKKEAFEAHFCGVSLGLIGCVQGKNLKVYGKSGDSIIDIPARELEFSWKKTFSGW